MKKIYMLGCALLLQLSGNLFAQAPYCAISATSGVASSSYYIDNFSTTGGIANISNLGTVCGTNNYEDRTAMIVSQFAGGPAVDFEIDMGPSIFDTFGVGIWIDWNENDVFNSGEQVFQSSGGYSNSFSGSFAVPLGTPVGTYRMRVLADFNNASPSNPCSLAFGQGEAEDYTFEVTPPPSCMPVAGLTIEGVSSNSIDISWTSQGTETDWNIEYGVSGFTPGSGTPGTASGTAEFTAGTLSAGTYYDFYVQADCGGGDESIWVGPITGYTGYCEFETIDPDYYIQNFSTTGGSTSNISNLGSGYGTNGYEDATSMIVSSFEGGPDINFTVDNGNGYYHGLSIWVDWNDNMIFESSEQVYSNGFDETFSGSFGVPLGTAVGSHRMRVLVDADNSSPDNPCSTDYGYGEAEDYTFEVVPTPSCLPVSDLEIDGETTNTIDIIWTAGDVETAWNIEWGAPGFTPGTGTGLDSAQTTTESYTVAGLDHSTNYDFYVQASCSSTDSSFWTLVSGATLCGAITNFPWTENFDAMPDLDYDLFPSCWISENGEWYTDDVNNNISNSAIPYSGNNYLGISYNSDDHIWTPEFQLTAGKKYEFSFMWAGDDSPGWNGEVFVNETQSSTGAISLGAEFVTPSVNVTADYRRSYYCFTPTVSGVYSFGIYVSSSFTPDDLTFDDFSLVERAATAGTGLAINACQIEGLVDLNDNATINDPLGNWTFSQNPSTIVNDTMFNPQFVPAGTVSVDYITYGCLVDTASVMVTIYPPSNAGEDGILTVCKNQPLNLLAGLSGNVDMGGTWYDPQNQAIASGQIMSANFPGQYNYDYITGNNVCPNDTAGVVVSVIASCNWLSVDEMALESVNLYPNPSTGLVFIESTFTEGTLNLVITDVNGRVIENGMNSIAAGTSTVNLSQVESGIYFFKLSSDTAEKVVRVVIQ
ncbi:GEVED domain-containing protein [Fluviicola taffensis]|uniref:Fibronectin type III domain protein n=1 Tax=Fluviicola taffensis (strain DSM 16823 / NCIMB 13979 / RW262) TaxID=755732 RepID=F2IGF1_FLUTR|nr:GEVED domain-containing protein [Fluviicola taffensis]AEA45817.1 Fibronectin type III domain protein [Fluviicola taffensis DSM 16823]